MARTIAFTGLGVMGGPMAANAIRSLGSIHVVKIVGAHLASVIAAGSGDRATVPVSAMTTG